MANLKSSKKRVLVNNNKMLRNKMFKSKMRTAIKKVVTSVSDNNKDEAQKNLLVAIKLIDKASTKHILHKNNSSRKKSQLTKLVNTVA